MAIQTSIMTNIPQITRSLVAMKLMAYTVAVWQSFFPAGGIAQDKRPAPPLSATTTFSLPSPTPTSPNHTVLHFPWVFVTFFLVTVIITIFLLITSARALNRFIHFSSSAHAFDSPVHTRVQVGNEYDKVQGKLVPTKRHLVVHMLSRSALRAILYGVIIRECFPTMAAFFTRGATSNWMANCAGAVTTLVTLAPTLLRRCFSYTICLVYLQWPVSSDRSKTSPVCPAMPVALSSHVDGQDPDDPEETSHQVLHETITAPETTSCENPPIPPPQVSLQDDAAEPTRTGNVTQEFISSDSLGNHVEPQPETREDLERTMASIHSLRDENTFTAISGPVTEEPRCWEREVTSDEPEIRNTTASVNEPPSADDEQQHHNPVESPCVRSDFLPGTVASLLETTLDHHVAEVPVSPDNVQATSSCSTPLNHVDSLDIPSSSSELILPDPHTPVRISRPERVNCLTQLPFNGEDLPLIDVPAVPISYIDTNVLVNSPNSVVEIELSPFYVTDDLLSTNMPLVGLTLEPINEEGDSDDLFEPSTPIPIRRTTERCLIMTYTPYSPRGNSDSNTPPSPELPVRYPVHFDLLTTSPVPSIGDDPFYVVTATTTPLSSYEDEVVPSYDWDIHNTSDDDDINLLPLNLSAIDDDLLRPSTSFPTPRPSSPLMSIRELDPAYREDNEFMSFFWSTATPEDISRLGRSSDNLLDVFIDLGGVGREPLEEPTSASDDYSVLEPSVSMLLDEIFPETSWRDEDDLLNDADLPGQPDVEDDWVVTEEMRMRMIELKKQFDARLAASKSELHEPLDPSSSSSSSHSFNFSETPSTSSSSSPPASSEIAPAVQSCTISLSPELESPLQTGADVACAIARPSSPSPTTSPPTMIPRAKPRPKSSLMNLTSAPAACRGLGSWR